MVNAWKREPRFESNEARPLEAPGLWEDEPEERRALQAGYFYEIQLEDCCIQGVLRGVFLGRKYDRGDDHDGNNMIYDAQYHFTFGWLEPNWGAWNAIEVSPGIDPDDMKYLLDTGEEM